MKFLEEIGEETLHGTGVLSRLLGNKIRTRQMGLYYIQKPLHLKENQQSIADRMGEDICKLLI